jgi:outer membrane biosynthesis protein TonB
MIHQKKRNSSKVNLIVSFVVHAALVGALVFFAAKEGLLGKKLKQLTVTMVPKEKKPEPPKEKPPEPKVEPPKPAEPPRNTTPVPPKVEMAATPPPANPGPAAAAPAVSAGSLPAFEFGDGAKEVQTISDPNGIYKAGVEHAIRSHWDRDETIDDSQYAAEVELSVDTKGRITDSRWLSLSGNARWDTAVKNAVAQTKALSKPPPKGFPPKFIVRFDVESFKSETIQLSSSN